MKTPRIPKTIKNKYKVAKLRPRNQVTIPQEILSRAGVIEGEYLAFRMISSPARVAAGSIIVEPRRLVEKTRSAAEWRRGEREADEDIRLGRVSKVFSDPDKLISELRKK